VCVVCILIRKKTHTRGSTLIKTIAW
jgi:hypothetical protein